VQEKRDTDYVILLDFWALAQGQSPTCYLAEEALEPYSDPVGTVVKTFTGPCKVLEVRKSDQVFVCEPVEWKLADYSSTQVKLFLNKESVEPIDSAVTTDACC
jgi:hypothetical protein